MGLVVEVTFQVGDSSAELVELLLALDAAQVLAGLVTGGQVDDACGDLDGVVSEALVVAAQQGDVDGDLG